MVLEKTIKLLRSKSNKWRPSSNTTIQTLHQLDENSPTDSPRDSPRTHHIRIKVKRSKDVPRIPKCAWDGDNLPSDDEGQGHAEKNILGILQSKGRARKDSGYQTEALATTPRRVDASVPSSHENRLSQTFPQPTSVTPRNSASNLDLLKFIVSDDGGKRGEGSSHKTLTSNVVQRTVVNVDVHSSRKDRQIVRRKSEVKTTSNGENHELSGSNDKLDFPNSEDDPESWMSRVQSAVSLPRKSPSERQVRTFRRDSINAQKLSGSGAPQLTHHPGRRVTSPDRGRSTQIERRQSKTGLDNSKVNGSLAKSPERTLNRVKSPERTLSKALSQRVNVSKASASTAASSPDRTLNRVKSPDRTLSTRSSYDSSVQRTHSTVSIQRISSSPERPSSKPISVLKTSQNENTYNAPFLNNYSDQRGRPKAKRSVSFSAVQHYHQAVQAPVNRSNTFRQSDPNDVNVQLTQDATIQNARNESNSSRDQSDRTAISQVGDVNSRSGDKPDLSSPRSGLQLTITKLTAKSKSNTHQDNAVKIRTYTHAVGPHSLHQQRKQEQHSTQSTENHLQFQGKVTGEAAGVTLQRTTYVKRRRRSLIHNKHVLRGVDDQIDHNKTFPLTASVHFAVPKASKSSIVNQYMDDVVKEKEAHHLEALEDPPTAVQLDRDELQPDVQINSGNAIVCVHGQGSPPQSARSDVSKTSPDNDTFEKETTAADVGNEEEGEVVVQNEDGQKGDILGINKSSDSIIDQKQPVDNESKCVVVHSTKKIKVDTSTIEEAEEKDANNDVSETEIQERFKVGSARPRRSITFITQPNPDPSESDSGIGSTSAKSNELDKSSAPSCKTKDSFKHTKRIIIIKRQVQVSPSDAAKETEATDEVDKKLPEEKEVKEKHRHRHKHKKRSRERRESEHSYTNVTEDEALDLVGTHNKHSMERSYRRSRRRKRDRDNVDIMHDKKIKVDPQKLIDYLTLVKENEKEYLALRRMGSAENKPVRNMLGIAGAYRRGHHENMQGQPESLVVQAAYELGNKTPHPISLRYEKMERKRAELIARASLVMHKQIQKRHRTDPHEVMDQNSLALPDELTFTPLERARAELEIWLKSLSAAQQIKAKELAIKQMGEEDRSMRKWWISQKYCKYLRQRHRPATQKDQDMG